MDVETLRRLVAAGKRQRYLMFWGHTARRPGALGAECFSQWYGAPFVVDGNRYPTAEHYMMAEKARLFGDDAARTRVLDAGSPAAAKAIGREVRGFDDAAWASARSEIVVAANVSKFTQHPALGAYLRATRDLVLVEASPVDRIWGIGLAASDERATNPLQWRGLNLLGFALMEVRARLA
jgi:ribA/ribD-fused uncharacterized protein